MFQWHDWTRKNGTDRNFGVFVVSWFMEDDVQFGVQFAILGLQCIVEYLRHPDAGRKTRERKALLARADQARRLLHCVCGAIPSTGRIEIVRNHFVFSCECGHVTSITKRAAQDIIYPPDSEDAC
jgi:hypothetical protein